MQTSTRFLHAFFYSVLVFVFGIVAGCDLCTCTGGIFILGGFLGGVISLLGWVIAGIHEYFNTKKLALLTEHSTIKSDGIVETPTNEAPVINKKI